MLSPTTLAGAANAAAPIAPAARPQPVRALGPQPAATPAAPQPPKTAAGSAAAPPRTMPRGSLLDLTV
jgi:hypothetical protein